MHYVLQMRVAVWLEMKPNLQWALEHRSILSVGFRHCLPRRTTLELIKPESK